MSASIPRFLLPRGSRPRLTRTFSRASPIKQRAASTKSPKPNSKPPAGAAPVLEQPTRFNPPSHGSRLPNRTVRYPGPALSSEQIEAQKTKKYPNMSPPMGTFSYWFLHNRSIHIYITLGVLGSLAGFSFIVSFRRESKFGHLLPEPAEALWHPIHATRMVMEVIRLDAMARTAETKERRARKVDDVAKRAEYRKAHGLETDGFGGWTAKEDRSAVAGVGQDGLGAEEGEGGEQQPRQKRHVKKWLGIW